jgi:hypothetical protein
VELVKKTGTVRRACIVNDVGGTVDLPAGSYRVQLLKSWADYEIGDRCAGDLIDPMDIDVARKAGTTGHTPEDYRKYSPALYLKTFTQTRTFDPKRVYFGLDDFIPDS